MSGAANSFSEVKAENSSTVQVSRGEYTRQTSSFRNTIPSEKFPAESGRYHLYVSFGCPFAHRTLIARALKGVEDCVSVSVTHWLLGEKGWSFDTENCPGATGDTVEHKQYISEIYKIADPGYTGKCTVPVLWDKKTRTIVNNESADIIRILNSAFKQWSTKNIDVDLYPEMLRGEIDEINQWMYDGFNNAVYKAGFATQQEPYAAGCKLVFETLDRIEEHLKTVKAKGKEFMVGGQLTETDIRLFVTCVRFDPVYFGHFKCNLRSIEHGYPEILKHMRRVYNYQYPVIANTVRIDHMKNLYYQSNLKINPTQIVALSNGPQLREE